MNYNGNLEMPSSYKTLTTDEMYEIDGGSQVAWDVLRKIGDKLFDIVFNYVVSRGIESLWKNRKKIWKQFLKGLKPTDQTRYSPYYKTFSNSIHY
ncbi:hypothetical protein [Agathobacter sp.]